MSLSYSPSEKISLKRHPDYSEKWVQEVICNDLSILGLGHIELVAIEKSLPNAGRLDLLAHDDLLNRRYEIELMLGKTDPSHIIRCIEYWDVERRRYPAYDHVAVLVAEDITSRFLNVMALLSGNIPLIAMQLSCLKVGNNIILNFTRVLDQTSLRTDDEYELGERESDDGVQPDQAYWLQRSTPEIISLCNDLLEITKTISGIPHQLQYRKRVINLITETDVSHRIWCIPLKSMLQVGTYVSNPELWIERFEEAGIPSSLRRGNHAVLAKFSPEDFRNNNQILQEFLRESITGNTSI